jgi:5-hydroxyisourate hydrolase
MGQLTSHVLDTMHGKPAAGIKIELYSLGNERLQVKSMLTNADGRCDQPLLNDEDMEKGEWELVFHVGEYFRDKNVETTDVPFLGQVPVRFGIDNRDLHYHIPLLVSPWSYTTYRGS